MSRRIGQRPRSFAGLAIARLRENRGRFRGEEAFEVRVDPNVVGRQPQPFLPFPSSFSIAGDAACGEPQAVDLSWSTNIYRYTPDRYRIVRRPTVGGSIRPPRDGEPDDRPLGRQTARCSLYPGLSEGSDRDGGDPDELSAAR